MVLVPLHALVDLFKYVSCLSFVVGSFILAFLWYVGCFLFAVVDFSVNLWILNV